MKDIEEDYALQPAIYDVIGKLLPNGGTVLELGSGHGDAKLVEKYTVYAVEHDENWLDVTPGVEYIHAPIGRIKPTKWHPDQNKWYDSDIIKNRITNLKYGLLIVDGPPANIGRGGFLKYRDCFDSDAPVIVDDINRYEEWKIMKVLANRWNKDILILDTTIERMFAVIAYKEQLKLLL